MPWHDERMVTLAKIALRLLEDAFRWVVLLFRSNESVQAEISSSGISWRCTSSAEFGRGG
jgi:hypothetical protein